MAGETGSTDARIGIALPVGLVVFAAFVFFYVWGWIGIIPANAFRNGYCAPDAPIEAPCRSVGAATITSTNSQRIGDGSGQTEGGYQITVGYTGQGRIPSTTVSFYNPTAPPLGKGDRITVTTWRGRPVEIGDRGYTAIVADTPGGDIRAVSFFASFMAALCILLTLFARRAARGRWSLVVTRAIDWTWLPGLVVGQILVLQNAYVPGFVVIGVAGLSAIVSLGAARYSLRAKVGASDLGRVRGRGGCPVSPRAQRWIEQRLTWLVDEFDLTPAATSTTVPARGFYPIAYSGTDGDVHELTRKVCAIMRVDYGRLRIRVIEDSHERDRAASAAIGAAYRSKFAAGTYQEKAGVYDIVLDAGSTADPAKLTAVIAHELGHVRLLGEQRIDSDRKDGEQLTDLATVAFGLGVFGANASFQVVRSDTGIGSTSLGYLDQRMWGYALACYAWLAADRDPHWAQALAENPRTYLKGGLKYLVRNAVPGGLPTLTEPDERPGGHPEPSEPAGKAGSASRTG